MDCCSPSPHARQSCGRDRFYRNKVHVEYQRDAEAPHVCPDVIVRLGGVRRVYSLRLQTQKQLTSGHLSASSAKRRLAAKGASAHRHVGSTAGAPGLGLGVHQAPADAKVTQLDLTFCIQEDVGGFDISVDHTVFLLQVQQRLHYLKLHKRLKKQF